MRHRRLAAAVVATSLLLPSTAAAASPIAGNDQAATSEDTSVAIDLLANDSDPDGDQLHIASFDQPAFGSVDVTPVLGYLRYTPDLDFNGQDRFSYTVSDGTGSTATALVTIFVNPVNDPPVASDRVATVAEDGSVSILFQARDPDKEGCDLVFIAEPNTSFGRLGPFSDAGCNPNGDMASAVYTPLPGYNGPDSISYVVSDGTVQSYFATVTITVTPMDDAPVALAGLASTPSGMPVLVTLNGYDWETCELGFEIAGQPAHGTLSPVSAAPCGPGGPFDQHVDSASVIYTPGMGYAGSDSFTFTVTDGSTVSAPATVTLTVVAPASVHVGDIDGSAIKDPGAWRPSATIRIDTAAHAPQSGAVVSGVWSNGASATCTTSTTGRCTVNGGSLARKAQSTTFRVTSVTIASAVYDAAANHDPDGDSTGTSITIARP